MSNLTRDQEDILIKMNEMICDIVGTLLESMQNGVLDVGTGAQILGVASLLAEGVYLLAQDEGDVKQESTRKQG